MKGTWEDCLVSGRESEGRRFPSLGQTLTADVAGEL